MKIHEIINESESELKFLIRIGGVWIEDIERSLTKINNAYEEMPIPETKKLLKIAIENAKADILKTIDQLALFDEDDKLINRIEHRYEELYRRLLNMKI